jgi:excisionase family DNA binding protein
MDNEEFNNAPADDRLHDLDTIAQRLNVSIRMVRRLIDRGELGYHQVGRLKRVSDGQYLEYLSSARRRRLAKLERLCE